MESVSRIGVVGGGQGRGKVMVLGWWQAERRELSGSGVR
jgi:hypothetical protein